ncbi:MAG: hypothetical protein QXZ68_04685 [Candidatus Bathyarchaeia archaeon]
MREAKKLGDKLIVHVHTYECTLKNKGYAVLPTVDKVEILKAFSFVDEVWVCSEGCDGTIVEALERLKREHPSRNLILAKGGDRTPENMPKAEIEVCNRLGIKIIYGVGGGKVESSSWLIKSVVGGRSE